MRGSKGFTLVEIIVAVALVAILSAAIAPSVLNNIAQGRISRAQSDVQAIAQAIMRFKNDTGKYPRLAHANRPDTAGESFDFLASLNGDWPVTATGADWATNQTFTDGQTANKSTEDFTSHLIFGKSRLQGSADSLYPRADNPDDPNDIGFRGALLSSDPADPWGNKYICNVAVLGEIGEPVWVISAGPNGVLETPVRPTGSGAATTLSGDDIGFRIQ